MRKLQKVKRLQSKDAVRLQAIIPRANFYGDSAQNKFRKDSW